MVCAIALYFFPHAPSFSPKHARFTAICLVFAISKYANSEWETGTKYKICPFPTFSRKKNFFRCHKNAIFTYYQ